MTTPRATPDTLHTPHPAAAGGGSTVAPFLGRVYLYAYKHLPTFIELAGLNILGEFLRMGQL